MDDEEAEAFWAGYWHAVADLEFGPCLIPDCPGALKPVMDPR